MRFLLCYFGVIRLVLGLCNKVGYWYKGMVLGAEGTGLWDTVEESSREWEGTCIWSWMGWRRVEDIPDRWNDNVTVLCIITWGASFNVSNICKSAYKAL